MLNVTALLTYALAVYMQIDDTTIPAPRATLQHHDTLSEYLYGILPSKLVPTLTAMALRSSDDTASGEGQGVKIS